MKNDVYWLWAQGAFGAASRAAADVAALHGGARYLHSLSYAEMRGVLPGMRPRYIERLCDKDLTKAERILEQIRLDGGFILNPDDEEYDERLRQLPSPPLCLFAKGTLPPADGLRVAIVGSRKATSFGASSARELARRLTTAGAVIVSGGARGVDTCAHEGCIEAGGYTVSVLGCGLSYDYNLGLRERILASGAVMTEYTPGTPPLGYNFPQRNRLIAALSDAVVVGQSGKRSGALITAGLAAEQGVSVYAIDELDGKNSTEGSRRTLEDGAIPITRANELLCDFMPVPPSERTPFTTLLTRFGEGRADPPDYQVNGGRRGGQKSRVKQNSIEKSVDTANFSIDAGKIYGILTTNPITVAEIESKTDLTPGGVFAALTELEMSGAIGSMPGKRYKRK